MNYKKGDILYRAFKYNNNFCVRKCIFVDSNTIYKTDVNVQDPHLKMTTSHKISSLFKTPEEALQSVLE
jgi:hypothetical protein